MPGRDVLAVLVSEAGSPCIERTLVSLASQTEAPVKIVVGVLGESTAPVDAFLARFDGAEEAVTVALGEQPTFFAAVDAAIGAAPPSQASWLWLLHDDSAPEAHALQALLDCAGRDANIGIVGPKQVRWDAPRELVEVGIRATRSARRIPEIDPGELDHGQYDDRFEVLGVGSAGMLVRRSALGKAGGLGGDFGPFGDGLELSRRMRAAGFAVAACPRAKVRHARRSLGEDERSSFVGRRVAQCLNALIAAPAPLVPCMLLAFLVLCPVRAAGRLAAKDSRLALGELAVGPRMLGRIGTVARGRSRLSAATVKDHRLRGFHERPHSVYAAELEASASSRETAVAAEVPDPMAIRAEETRARHLRGFGVAYVAVAFAVGLLAQLPRLALRGLEGGALRGDGWGMAELVRGAAQSWLPSGDGMAAPVDALWALLSPLAFPAGLGFGVSCLVLLGVPLAAAVAFASTGWMAVSPAVRGAGALVWACAPPFLDALGAGQVAGVVVHLLVPVLLAALHAAFAGSLAGIGGASVLLAFAAASSPAFVVAGLGVALVGAAAGKGGRWRWLWLPVPAVAVLVPTFAAASALAGPWRLAFATPGVPVPVSQDALALFSFSPLGQASLDAVAAGEPGALVRVVAAGVLLACAVGALYRPRRFATVRLGWFLVACGWAWAIAAAGVVVSVRAEAGRYLLVSGWTGIGLSIAFAGLWIVLVDAAEGLRSTAGNPAAKPAAAALVLVAAAAPMVVAGYWAADSLWGSASLLGPAGDHVPAVARAGEESANRSRVLALTAAEDGLDAEIWRGNGLELHEASMVAALANLEAAEGTGPLAQANADLAAALASLSGSGEGLAQVLRVHAIGVVLVPASVPANAAGPLRAALNSVDGLEFVTENDTGAFWRVGGDGEASRLSLEGEDGTLSLASGIVEATSKVPAGKGERTLRLAERADSGWNAVFVPEGGEAVPLEATGGAWSQQWRLPAEAGTVRVRHERPFVSACAAVAGLALLAGLVLALPVRGGGGKR